MKKRYKIIVLAVICLLTVLTTTACSLMPYFNSDGRVRVVGDRYDSIVGVFGETALVSRNDRFFLIWTRNGNRASSRFDVISGHPTPEVPFFGAQNRGVNYLIDARTGDTVPLSHESVHRTRGRILVETCPVTGMSYIVSYYRNAAANIRPRILYFDTNGNLERVPYLTECLSFMVQALRR